ncbi:MAG TPA: hypothetical protein VI981_02140 [Candidatus Paceibacterota bacterium]
MSVRLFRTKGLERELQPSHVIRGISIWKEQQNGEPIEMILSREVSPPALIPVEQHRRLVGERKRRNSEYYKRNPNALRLKIHGPRLTGDRVGTCFVRF